MSSPTGQRGFTLIELMVVVFLIAIVMTGVGLSIGATARAKLRSSCWTLVAATRYAFSRAVTQGSTTRLILDFEKRTLHIEETRGRVVLTREDQTGEGLRRAGEEDEPDGGPETLTLLDRQMNSIGSAFGGDVKPGSGGAGSPMSPLGGLGGMGADMGMMLGGAGGGDMTGMMDGLVGGRLTDPFLSSMQNQFSGNPAGYRRPRFKALPGTRGEKRELEGNTIFRAVYTPHEPTAREDGRAFIYFFPGGMTEHSIVQLSDGDDRIYSVEIHPLTGRAVIHNEEVEPEGELDDLQEADE